MLDVLRAWGTLLVVWSIGWPLCLQEPCLEPGLDAPCLFVSMSVLVSLHISSNMMLTCTTFRSYLVKDFSELCICLVKDGKGNCDLMILGKYVFRDLDHFETACSKLRLAHSEQVDTVWTVCGGTFARPLLVCCFWPKCVRSSPGCTKWT